MRGDIEHPTLDNIFNISISNYNITSDNASVVGRNIMTRWKTPKANRGKMLEDEIMKANESYKARKLALIDKVPTPWNVKNYDARKKRASVFPKRKSTVDFSGASNGRSIAFETKSTKENTRFPLSNIKQHQIDYLNDHKEQGGISFLIIEFEKLNETYFVEIDDLNPWIYAWKNGGRASIPYSWFMVNMELIKPGNGIRLNYWDIMQKYIKKGEENRIKNQK